MAEESILEEAQRLVHGPRQKDYKHPIYDYTATGRMWAAVLSKHLGVHIEDIDPRICCLMMCCVKISREAGVHKRDNNVDLAGYAECAQLVAEEQEKDVSAPEISSSDASQARLDGGVPVTQLLAGRGMAYRAESVRGTPARHDGVPEDQILRVNRYPITEGD